MPVYEFECPKGHVTEDVVPMGTKEVPCVACAAEAQAISARTGKSIPPCFAPHVATRILSATPTTFRYNDRR